jgi:hypothetical protein
VGARKVGSSAKSASASAIDGERPAPNHQKVVTVEELVPQQLLDRFQFVHAEYPVGRRRRDLCRWLRRVPTNPVESGFGTFEGGPECWRDR